MLYIYNLMLLFLRVVLHKNRTRLAYNNTGQCLYMTADSAAILTRT